MDEHPSAMFFRFFGWLTENMNVFASYSNICLHATNVVYVKVLVIEAEICTIFKDNSNM